MHILLQVGGGFGKGIHNILEPACWGIPVLFGPNHKKFREAVELISGRRQQIIRELSKNLKNVLNALAE